MVVSQILAVALVVAGAIVAIVLLIKGVHGLARVLGILGTALVLLGVMARFAYRWMVELYLGQVDNDVIIRALAADLVGGAVLAGAGVLLLTGALAVASRPTWMDRPRHGKRF